MQLQNPFPQRVRLLYLDCWKCWLCGENGQRNGGLEIHHIMGRISASAFNSSCLCKKCHSRMGHSQQEEQTLFFTTLKYLKDICYNPVQEDYEFLVQHYQRLVTEELKKWLAK